MAKIPLRAYIKEIENQIERGEIEQAVAHAKNILKSYPKNIDTYRLLGKAYLESQNFSEAADILQRVLSVIPDDFISQIGMSIIREDEGNLDASIWHMERAYEVQPFNPAVQEELRRLYGRRDGIEPPKIRLTRGALVRMYARGELYTQAIAETRAALAEDPQRMDLLVLLARLYYLSGHTNDAAEVCSELIRKLPYCYEANKLLAEFLPSTNRAEEAQNFLQRIYALDPYSAFLSPTAPTSDQVPDQAVMVEQFTWESAMEESQTPEWTRNVGVAWEESPEEALPDWINSLKPETPPTTEQAPERMGAVQEAAPTGEMEGSGLAKDELIPDWMKDAGWIPSDRKADEIMASQPEPEEAEILPADLPDWVQSIAPREVEQTPGEEERTDWLDSILAQPGGDTEIVPPPELEKDESQQGLPNWVTGAGTGTQMSAAGETAADNLPDWFAQMEEEKQPAESETLPTGEIESAEFEGLPDWTKLGEPSISEEPSDAGKTPDWLRTFDLPATEAPAQAEQPAGWMQEIEPEAPGKTEEPGGLTDWLNSIEPETTDKAEEAGGLTDWLKSEGAQTPAQAEEAGGPTDWLQSVEPESTEKAEETTGITGWLQSIQPEPAKPSAEAEIPDWLQSISEEEEAIILPQEALPEEGEVYQEVKAGLPEISELPEVVEQPVAEIPVEMPPEDSSTLQAPQEPAVAEETPVAFAASETMPDFSDMDTAMAWLESLAAKQGADEATLVTPPEQRLEQPPDWVTKEMETQEAALPEAQIELPEQAAEPAANVEPADQEKPAGIEEEVAGELPDWLQAEKAEVEIPPAEEEPMITEEDLAAHGEPEGEVPDWLRAAKPELVEETSEETIITAPMAAAEAAVQPEATVPDFSDMDAAMAWLESLAAKQGADEATLVTPPEQRLEQPPEWVTKEAESAEPSLPAAEVEVHISAEEPALPEPAPEQTAEWLELGEALAPEEAIESAPATAEQPVQPAAAAPDFSDMDAAMAWLESLAAKQGADEATLVTPMEQRLEQPPEWVKKEMEAEAESTVQEQATVEPETLLLEAFETAVDEYTAVDEIPVEPVVEEELAPAEEAVLPDWLQDAITEETLDVGTTEPVRSEEPAAEAGLLEEITPAPVVEADQLEGIAPEPAGEAELPVSDAPEVETQAVPAGDMDLDAAFAWLESLAEKQGADEATLVTSPEERLETPPEWVQEQASEQEAVSMEEIEAETAAIEPPPVDEMAPLEEPFTAVQAAPEGLEAEEASPIAEKIAPAVEEIEPVFEETDEEPVEAVPDWLSSIEQEEPVEAGSSEETTPWPSELQVTPEQPVTSEPIPDWLQVPETAEPAAATVASAEPEKIPDWLMGLEEESETEALQKEMELPPVAGDIRSAWEPEVEISHPPARAPEVQAPAISGSLIEVQTALSRGELDQALVGYNNFIQNGEHLEETIHDLRDALYRYPVDISIWQALGDAYARNNQLQEALDAYTKAEELLR